MKPKKEPKPLNVYHVVPPSGHSVPDKVAAISAYTKGEARAQLKALMGWPRVPIGYRLEVAT